jgi:beta-lysine 5,6-aminomutase beta subunit
MIVKAYGDTLGDGAVQLSFTLPVSESEKAREAARQFVLALGFRECQVVHSARLAEGFSFFVAYGRTDVGVDLDAVRVEEAPDRGAMGFEELNRFVREKLGRPIVVVGACTGSDAHTVGIDAILNMKGYHGHYGLERYPEFRVHNLGAQVPNEKLVQFAVEADADALLVSQVVTQKDVHVANLTGLIELLENQNLRGRFVTIVGGPRITHALARELGFDAGFGRATLAEHVGTYLARSLVERKESEVGS